VVGVVRGEDAVKVAEEGRVVGGVDEPLLVDALQHRLRAVPDRVPKRRIEPREQLARRPIPAVPEIVGELFEPDQAARQPGIDLQDEGGAGRLHAGYCSMFAALQ
jgi:hypothetical protein